MNFEIHTQTAIFDELKPEWDELVERSTTNTIFNTWEWHSAWWNAYQPGDLWVVTCRDDAGQLIGLAPWFVDADRSLRFIGCEDVTDYLDVIVDRDRQDAVMVCFADFLRENQAAYDRIELCNIPAESPTLEMLTNLLKQRDFEATVEQQEVCPVFKVPETWDGYLQLLDKKQRHEVRRKLRRAEGASEQINWYMVDASHDVQAQIDLFFELMAASDEDKRAFLQDESHKAFFRQMTPLMLEKGWLNLNFLTVNGEPTAAYLNFEYDSHILVYNSGLKVDPYGYLSPGILLLVKNIQYAIDKGYAVFDFLRGDEIYKYRMGGKDTAVMKLSAWIDL